jgi:hypothetical protein
MKLPVEAVSSLVTAGKAQLTQAVRGGEPGLPAEAANGAAGVGLWSGMSCLLSDVLVLVFFFLVS